MRDHFKIGYTNRFFSSFRIPPIIRELGKRKERKMSGLEKRAILERKVTRHDRNLLIATFPASQSCICALFRQRSPAPQTRSAFPYEFRKFDLILGWCVFLRRSLCKPYTSDRKGKNHGKASCALKSISARALPFFFVVLFSLGVPNRVTL